MKHNHERKHSGRFPFAVLAAFALLKSISKEPSHGYRLVEELSRAFEREIPRPMVYKLLRALEERGLVESKWDFPQDGPARKVYYITDKGLEVLERMGEQLKKLKDIIERLIS